MLAQEIIRTKRDGSTLTTRQIEAFVSGITTGTFSDSQIAALAMAIVLNGMDRDETTALTLAMRDSGEVLDWSHLPGPVVDKHSTGGVGDCVSLVLAPLLAACGCFVPMISGRGLGHTGGTLDKMDAIPGYQSQPDMALFRQTVREAGCAIIGANASLAPADKRLYAIRDVTATVESIPLIAASILSKKLAAGISSLVVDVKVGNGAFITSEDDATALAETLCSVATAAGTPTRALLTDMSQPLANAAGNAIEVQVAIDVLTGQKQHPRLTELILTLAAELLLLSGTAHDIEVALKQARMALDTGAGAEHFGRMVASLGGPADFVERADSYLPQAPIIRPVEARETGFVAKIATREIGQAVIALGGGRRQADDPLDLSVGFSNLLHIGHHVEKGDPLGFVHARNEAEADSAAETLQAAYRIQPTPPKPGQVILGHAGPISSD